MFRVEGFGFRVLAFATGLQGFRVWFWVRLPVAFSELRCAAESLEFLGLAG